MPEAEAEKPQPAKEYDSDTDFQPDNEPDAADHHGSEDEHHVAIVDKELKNLETQSKAPVNLLPAAQTGKQRLY